MVLFLSGTLSVFAHAVISPSQTSTSRYENFSLGVPNEKNMPTVAIRLLIPEQLDRITPFVKPGWRIDIIKDETGKKITEIQWLQGAIPAGQKDMFQFTARTPESGQTLVWKAYQTYADGSVVGWDRDPRALQGGEEKVANPYSVTEVTADSLSSPAASALSATDKQQTSLLSLAAFVIASLALGIAFFRR